MIVQLTTDIAVNTDWIECIERGNEIGETFVILRGGKYTKDITVNLPMDEVLAKLKESNE